MTGSTRDAVLLLAFNRPQSLRQVIDATRVARPPRVYLAVDGPRHDRAEDADAVAACRQLAAEIDWTPEVHTLFSDENLGCGLGVSRAITWFFENEERGIIVEDDVIPTAAFFDFQGALLDRYADDPRVFSVAGSSYVPSSRISQPGAYRFSRYPYVWGWGTWRRSWASYRFDISGWRDELSVRDVVRLCGGSWRAAVHWIQFLDDCASGRIDTWDGQLVLAALRTGASTAVANVNLADNIGFGEGATHTRRRPDFLVPSGRVILADAQIPVVVDERADAWTVRHQFGATLPRFAVRQSRRLAQR